MAEHPPDSRRVLAPLKVFGGFDQPYVAWYTAPLSRERSSGVLILPAVAYEQYTTHRAVRELAERLAADGHHVLRLDYPGTGDSSSDLWDSAVVQRWEQIIPAVVNELKSWDLDTISLVGLRLGGMLALRAATIPAVDRVVAWMPVVSGRRYVRELRLLSTVGPEPWGASGAGQAHYLAGCALTPAFLAELEALNLDSYHTQKPLLVVERPEHASARPSLATYISGNATADFQAVAGGEGILDVLTERAQVPRRQLDAITDWLNDQVLDTPPTHGVSHDPKNEPWYITRGGHRIRERVGVYGLHRLIGIESESDRHKSQLTVVFLNTGSDYHVGPGRAWVELSRQLAAQGLCCLRVDFRGWGESPDNGYAPGRPYSLHTADDIADLVDTLGRAGHGKVLLVGLCASAWIAMQREWPSPVVGIVGFNPQMYWRTGDPQFATITESDTWFRAGEAMQWKDDIRRSHVRAWWHRLMQMRYRCHLFFSHDDPGWIYLRDMLGVTEHRQPRNEDPDGNESEDLTGASAHLLPRLDHAMHKQWLREDALQAILQVVKLHMLLPVL